MDRIRFNQYLAAPTSSRSNRPEAKTSNKPKPQKANVAQKPANDSKPSNANQDPNPVAQNDEQDPPITANAGKFVIQVTKSDAIDQMTLGRKPSSNRAANLLLEQLQNGSAQNATNNFQKNQQFSGGNPVPWMAPGPFNFYDPSFEEGLDGEIIAYFQEENDTEHLTISGELKVTPGRRIEVEFPDGKPSTKKSGQHSFTLKEIQSNDRGIHVSLSLPQLTKKRGNQFGNPQAMLKAVLDQQGAFEVLIQDSEGVLHSPGASGSAGGSSSASGSGGGNGNGGGAFGQDSQSNSTQTFTFGGLPYGRDIKSVIVRATEKTGKPQSYPFKLSKVPVPYGTK